MDVYADEPDVVWIAISENTPGVNFQTLRNWTESKGWSEEDVRVGKDDGDLRIFQRYGEIRDTWMVIGRDGRVVYRKGYGNTVSETFPAVRQAVDTALESTPVRLETWGRIKGLFN